MKGLPAMDLPGLNSVSIAQGCGCAARRIERPGELVGAVGEALAADGANMLEVVITSEVPPLI